MSKIRAVTFDNWGTLVVPHEEHRRKRVEPLRQILLLDSNSVSEVRMGEIVDRVREICDRHMEWSGVQHGIKTRACLIHKRLPVESRVGLTTEVIEKLDKAMEKLMLEYTPRLREVDLLDSLARLEKAGVRMGVISNTGFIEGRYFRKVWEKLGIGRYLEFALFSDEVGVAKPDRTIFRAAGEKFGLPVAEICHIGDSFLADYQGALKAGFGGAVWLSQRPSKGVVSKTTVAQAVEYVLQKQN